MASAFQYTLILAHKEGEIETAEGSRGGAALLLNKRSFEAGAENDEITTNQDGRLAIREVAWEGMIFKIASIYVPSEADYRKRYIIFFFGCGNLFFTDLIHIHYLCAAPRTHTKGVPDQRHSHRSHRLLQGYCNCRTTTLSH